MPLIKTGEITIRDAIERLLQAYRLKNKVYETQLSDTWAQVAGKVIARHTRSLYIRNNKLHIRLDSAVIRQELTFARKHLIKKVNEALGADYIEDIVLM